MPTMIAQNTGFNSNASDPSGTVFYAMQPATGTLPTGGPVGTTATLTFATTGPVHPMTNPNDYTLNASITGLTPKCEIAMGGVVFADPTIYGPMTGTKGTLQINYPMFTGTGSFTINCIGAQGTAYTAQTSLTVTVP